MNFAFFIYSFNYDFYSENLAILKSRKIVITGGPGTGKTSVINELKNQGYTCLEEISRQVTLDARKDGTEQLFLTDPVEFSRRLLKGRIAQFEEASSFPDPLIFIDRGIPDILAYMHYINVPYPDFFKQASKLHSYDHVFVLPPWASIFESDSERYENFDQAKLIHENLLETYSKFDYQLHEVPFGSIVHRADFILDVLKEND